MYMSKVRFKMSITGWKIIFIAFTLVHLSSADINLRKGDVGFEEFADKYYQINFDESVLNKTLFKIEGAIKSLTLDAGSCTDLAYGSTLTKTMLYLNKSLDYETNTCSDKYRISDGTETLLFRIFLKNLDDNEPQFDISSKCSFNENTIYTKENSTCAITMSDLDGLMNFTKLALKEDFEKFGVSFEPMPDGDDKTATIVIYLQNGQLDYEERTSYVLIVTAQEQVNSGEFQIQIDVGDQPDTPPVFTKISSTERFYENIDQEFTVKAVDGDYGINSSISYEIKKNGCDNYKCSIEIDATNGQINVKNVDREEVGDKIELSIAAIESDDNTSTIKEIQFFIMDQDDECPKIINEGDKTIFNENEGFEGSVMSFSVKDMDLSEYGTFTVTLSNVKSASVDYTKAFKIIPNSGYQTANFNLTVINSTLLDYENEDWQVINLNIIAIEKANNKHTDSMEITIKLIDINDEPPIFVNTVDSVKIREDIGQGETIFNASATDKDKGDTVTYAILGIWNEKLNIDENGLITTKKDSVFDYELLPQVMISITASDTIHLTTKILTIYVIDVDDEPPVMRINISTDDGRAKIEENSKDGSILNGVSIEVTDPDTKPEVQLKIDWDTTFITKNSRIVTSDKDIFYKCFAVETTGSEVKALKGQIIIKSSQQGCPDYEKFDAISLSLTALDVNTEKGSNYTKGSILITIIDINDNTPTFINKSLDDLKVTDGTNTKTKIGVVSAHDDDVSDILKFYLRPVNGEPDWVSIDENSGALSVKENVVIDCDKPARQDIFYEITVYDGDPSHNYTREVSIHIDDVNDNEPTIHCNPSELKVMEQTGNGTSLQLQLSAEDLDRDPANKEVVFSFDTTVSVDVANRFSINAANGELTVCLRNGASLDRDYGPSDFILPILVHDNPKGTIQLRAQFELNVTLLDLDNHIPVLETKSIEDCFENEEEDTNIGSLIAIDPDEDGPNSNVTFQLKSIVPSDKENKQILDATFFDIQKTGDKTASVKVTKPLKGYWGKYNLTITTKDLGNDNASMDNIVSLEVNKYNFEPPEFHFPNTDKEEFIIDKDFTSPKTDMIFPNGSKLPPFDVDDKQDHKWDVSFEIMSNKDLFRIIKNNTCRWQGILQTIRPLGEEEEANFTVTVRASVKADKKTNESIIFVDTTVGIKFFSNSEQPQFDNNTEILHMDEGINVKANFTTKARYSFPEIPDLKIYYFLLQPAYTFKINTTTGELSATALDYNEKNGYELKVVAMNKNTIPSDNPNEKSILHLTIQVDDLNDHPPVFHPSEFTGALLRNSGVKETILTINVTDADPTSTPLKFSLDSCECSKRLSNLINKFEIDSYGKITCRDSVTSDMSGFCKFNVVVTDPPDKNKNTHTVRAPVVINVISTDELVTFTFLNPDYEITQNQKNVTDSIDLIFDTYKYTSYFAELTYDKNYGNSTAKLYFLNDKLDPVLASEILGNLTDTNKYSALTIKLAKFGVHLSYFSEDKVLPNIDDDLKTWLVVTIIILGSLLIFMTLILFFRNRALTQRIKNLSTTKFGSQESDLNRAGVIAPTTNKNAIEGSNPVFNSESYIKEVEDDRMSVMSGDSDLLGVEDNPDFDFKEE